MKFTLCWYCIYRKIVRAIAINIWISIIWSSIAVYFNAKSDIRLTHYMNSIIAQPEITILDSIIESNFILIPGIIVEF